MNSIPRDPQSSKIYVQDMKTVETFISQHEEFLGHFVGQLKLQNVSGLEGKFEGDALTSLVQRIEGIYDKHAEEAKKVFSSLKSEIHKETQWDKKGVTSFQDRFQVAEKKVLESIEAAQLEALQEIGTTALPKASRDLMTLLLKGGIRAHLVRFAATLTKVFGLFASFAASTAALKEAKGVFEKASRKDFDLSLQTETLSEIEQKNLKDFKAYQEGGDLKTREGVIGVNRMYRFEPALSQKRLKKQWKAFISQERSAQARGVIEKKGMEIGGEKFDSTMTPFNEELDKHYASLASEDHKTINVFGRIFGKAGISTLNRKKQAIFNTYLSEISQGEGKNKKIVHRVFRSGILANRYEKDATLRQAASKEMAQQLLKGALMTELADLGMTLADAARAEQPLELHFNSVSLVTPDIIRAMWTGKRSEKAMFEDQAEALKNSRGIQTLEIDGVPIKVNVHVNVFNFGVNALAQTHLNPGSHIQHSYNQEAFKGLETQFRGFEEKMKKAASEDPSITRELDEARNLLKEIETLTKTRTAYLKGDPYEAPSKIVALTNRMNEMLKGANTSAQDAEKKQRTGYFVGLNCMSGKDRTGVADAKAASELISHQVGKKTSKEKEEFFQTLLKEAGSLKVTEINTGVAGVKVGKEGRVNPSEQSFSKLVSS